MCVYMHVSAHASYSRGRGLGHHQGSPASACRGAQEQVCGVLWAVVLLWARFAEQGGKCRQTLAPISFSLELSRSNT